jgi:hypothetical protein
MLNLLDELLREVVLLGTPLLIPAQVRFQPPDAQLRADVLGLNQMVVNAYLVELRENRKLRSNERTQTIQSGFVYFEQAPERVECHYLLSAWSPAQLAPGIEPTVDEHALLYETIAALTLAAPFNPARVYTPADPRLALWPVPFRDVELPTTVLSEGFGKLSEFWSTMGTDARWKPVIHLIVTLPVALARELAGALVTTTITDYQQDALSGTIESWLNIGGHVQRTLGGGATAVVPSAWVRIETLPGVPLGFAETDVAGRFVFDQLRAGQYRLRAGAPGLGPITRVVDVPSETAEYDLQFP